MATSVDKFLATSTGVLLNIGGQASPDLQAKLAFLNTRKYIATHLVGSSIYEIGFTIFYKLTISGITLSI
jgi:hypothetical protein